MKSVSWVYDFVIEMKYFFHYVCSILFPFNSLQRVSIFCKFGQYTNNKSHIIDQSDIGALRGLYHIYSTVSGLEVWLHHDVMCLVKIRPVVHFIVLRKTIKNTKRKCSIDFEFFTYHESTMTHRYLRYL